MRSVVLAALVSVVALLGTGVGTLHASEQSLDGIALVIGNNNYARSPLNNAVNDARLIGKTLGDLGFQVVTKENLESEEMTKAIADFAERLADEKTIGFFYFAGHGFQSAGKSYLMPIDAWTDRAGAKKAVNLDQLLSDLGNAQNDLNVLILDACRSDIFMSPDSTAPISTLPTTPIGEALDKPTRGFARPPVSTMGDSLIFYSTRPNEVAFDGDGPGDPNGPFANALAASMRFWPRKYLHAVMFEAKKLVETKTAKKQRPWLEGDPVTELYLVAQDAQLSQPPGTVFAVKDRVAISVPGPYQTNPTEMSSFSDLYESANAVAQGVRDLSFDTQELRLSGAVPAEKIDALKSMRANLLQLYGAKTLEGSRLHRYIEKLKQPNGLTNAAEGWAELRFDMEEILAGVSENLSNLANDPNLALDPAYANIEAALTAKSGFLQELVTLEAPKTEQDVVYLEKTYVRYLQLKDDLKLAIDDLDASIPN